MSTLAVAGSSARKRQGDLGQFLTPAPVADFMASLFGPLPDKVRILDAGAGAGALTEAFILRVCNAPGNVSAIEVVLYEVDSTIQNALRKTMRRCHQACLKAGISFTYM